MPGTPAGAVSRPVPLDVGTPVASPEAALDFPAPPFAPLPTGTAYRFYGHRLLFRRADAGEEEAWQDVPEHFGRFYPSTLRLPAGTVTAPPEGAWFARQLREIVARPPVAYRLSARAPARPAAAALLCNCLDPVFGHALYKLAAARALAEAEPARDVIVVVSGNLLPYAAFAAGAVVVEEPLERLLTPGANLMDRVTEVTAPYRTVQWAFCNGSRTGPQQVLPGFTRPASAGPASPSMVTFVHRDDRTWGPTPGAQVRRVNRTFGMLRARHPDLVTAVIGVSQGRPAYRADRNLLQPAPSPAFEEALAELARQTACLFGVHGSHLLVPSYHAAATVELQPLARLGNAVQAHWPHPAKGVIEALYCYRVVYGGRRLWDVRAATVARVVDSVVTGLPGLRARLDDRVLYGPFPA